MQNKQEIDKVTIGNEIRAYLQNYVEHSPYRFNPDSSIVETTIKGLTKRKIKYGYAYCPCRVVTGDVEEDAKITCPCVYHEREIERDGICHCRLFVNDEYISTRQNEEAGRQEKQSIGT